MTPSDSNPEENILQFTLDGLLPPTQTLIIKLDTRTATLFSLSPHEPPHFIAQQSFPPNGMRLLVLLLESYPHYCPYETMLTHLFSISPEKAHELIETRWELAIRPLRRAIGSLMTGLRSFGLRICNIRGTGYLIEPTRRRKRS